MRSMVLTSINVFALPRHLLFNALDRNTSTSYLSRHHTKMTTMDALRAIDRPKIENSASSRAIEASLESLPPGLGAMFMGLRPQQVMTWCRALRWHSPTRRGGQR